MTTLLAFLFVLGVLSFVHELGHFVMARRVGVKVLKFSLGFGPRLVGFKRGDTEYVVSAIPLGGYVKMAGENPDDPRSGRDDEFLSKSKWERFQILIMGPLMNKGLEVIEAHWLFDLPGPQIDVVIHPQSIVHSMVELTDGSVIAQLGGADMKLPIQYACSYPDRWDAPVARLDLTETGRLDFQKPDLGRFPCLGLAYRALESGPSHAVVLNAANEVAVASYLDEKISFVSIPRVIEQTMDAHSPVPALELEAIREIDRWARRFSQNVAKAVELKV